MSTIYETHVDTTRLSVDRIKKRAPGGLTSWAIRVTLNEPAGRTSIALDEESARVLAEAIMAIFWRSGNRPDGRSCANTSDATDPLRYEPDVCGTHHLIAERTLRIIETAAITGNAIPYTEEAIETLSHLVSRAGVHLARRALGHPLDDDIPF